MDKTVDYKLLRASVIGEDLSEQECQVLASIMTARHLQDGELLVAEAQADNTLFILIDGPSIWAWLVQLVPDRHRTDARAVGERAWTPAQDPAAPVTAPGGRCRGSPCAWRARPGWSAR